MKIGILASPGGEVWGREDNMNKRFVAGFVAGVSAVLALGAQVTLRTPGPGSTPGGSVVHAALLNVNLGATGQAIVNLPLGKFSAAPSLAVTAQFVEGAEAHMGRVMVDQNSGTSFRITVVNGSGGPVVGPVQVSYVAAQ
jgi:hypothetical protein